MKFVAEGKTYVDTAFLGSHAVRSTGTLEHRGFGEFKSVTPVGTVYFTRGVAFAGCSGRSHTVSGDAAAVALVLGASETAEAGAVS